MENNIKKNSTQKNLLKDICQKNRRLFSSELKIMIEIESLREEHYSHHWYQMEQKVYRCRYTIHFGNRVIKYN